MGKKTKIGYMCGIAFQHELENTDVTVHPSKGRLMQSHRAGDECGIAKVEVKFIRWIKKPKI